MEEMWQLQEDQHITTLDNIYNKTFRTSGQEIVFFFRHSYVFSRI